MKIFDAHFHLIDPRFPLTPNQGYLPPNFTVLDYQVRTKMYPIGGGAVVSGSFQGYDTRYLVAALDQLGTGFCGVANIEMSATDKALDGMDQAGIRAVRFNMFRMGSSKRRDMSHLSDRLRDRFGWRSELYIDSGNLSSLRIPKDQFENFSVDHLGLTRSGLPQLYRWVENGTRVKATGFGRLDFEPLPVLRQIHSINPGALMFGTDLPSTRAPQPFASAHLELIQNNFAEKDLHKILWENAREWYRPA